MSSVLTDRIVAFQSVLAGRDAVRHVGLGEAILSTFRWYGFHRRRMAGTIKVSEIDGQYDWVESGDIGVAWPRRYPLERLIGALIELRAPSNSHYYFSGPGVVNPGDVVLDVGASEGAFAVECLLRRNAAHVWCIEPEASMVSALRVTAERNGLGGRLHVVPAAAGNTTGTVRIVENPDDPLVAYCVGETADDPGSGAARDITSTRIDDWIRDAGVDRLNFLKIDAEGSDLAVLEGARDALRRWKPGIAVTTYHRPEHCNRIAEFLDDLHVGYQWNVRGLVVFNGVPRPVMLHASASPHL